ncbi:iron chelate uptake ABC transporter family permease subunit [Marinobacter nanhaiticus D15-8W]|uniref:Iron ABC transporter permease n=1 Tax=Marinobacter nanhaiticus D15-8W TaxID=626887 RepID=N6WWT4_9GAMM|nr:iron chelate uptake ABC transporter family permease subunit [Marinobacter nanhaiticus]ENO15537.1 iron ABC transporter permease [Marinobacter nanhaiticus D15-8W]BES73613.1 iron chelate uptake ABC transporter family permease subunit [Marinobacter nanhaiticus D15-8W]
MQSALVLQAVTSPRLRWLWLTPLVLLSALIAGTAIGETRIPVETVLKVLANRLWGAGYPVDRIDEGIVWSYRLSRAIVAASCGAGLALAGVVLQALLRNPLAEPFLMGISAGASTGAVAVTVAGIGAGAITLSMGAFAGATLAFGLVVMLAHAATGGAGGGRGLQAAGAIILSGIAGSQLFNALTAFIIAKSANAEQARGIMFWLLGNLSGVRWEDVVLAVPAAVGGLLVCLWHMRALDAFTFGADSAASLGIAVRPVRGILIATTALVTAVMVSMVGAIGFVGLVIPHAMRFIVGSRHARLVPASALAGAVFLIGSDILSRILVPGQVLPIGVITSLIGAPAFALILIRGTGAR